MADVQCGDSEAVGLGGGRNEKIKVRGGKALLAGGGLDLAEGFGDDRIDGQDGEPVAEQLILKSEQTGRLLEFDAVENFRLPDYGNSEGAVAKTRQRRSTPGRGRGFSG